MRPEMTLRTALKLLEWSDLSRLRIVIDGLRYFASADEGFWRDETITYAEKIAETDSRVEVKVFSQNIGFTNHSLRVQKLIFKNANSGIMLEEDNDISEIGLNFLQKSISTVTEPAVFTSYSSSNHTGTYSGLEYRRTLFSQLWGNAINETAHYALEKTWLDKSVDTKMIEKTIYDLIRPRNLNEKNFAKRTSKYWSQYFYNGLISPRHTDIALMYAMWSCDGILGAPWQNLSTDLSHLDFRGMNQRDDQRDIGSHTQKLDFMENTQFCKQCEIRDSRVVYGIFNSKLNSVKYRLNRLNLKIN
jgi:hypothetical protein